MNALAKGWLDAAGGLADGVIVVALGGNIGGVHGVQKRCTEAIAALSAEWGPAHVSRSYLTAPVGEVQEQPDFLNAVASWRPTRPVPPEAVLARLQALEKAHGRERLVPGGARSLDLDLLLVGKETRQTPGLVLPHPRMHKRAFVLSPMLDLFGPGFRWRGAERSLREYLAASEVANQACRPVSPRDQGLV